MFCNHKWKSLSTHKFESELKNITEARMPSVIMTELSKRGVISVIQCEKCGKIEHIKTIL